MGTLNLNFTFPDTDANDFPVFNQRIDHLPPGLNVLLIDTHAFHQPMDRLPASLTLLGLQRQARINLEQDGLLPK